MNDEIQEKTINESDDLLKNSQSKYDSLNDNDKTLTDYCDHYTLEDLKKEMRIVQDQHGTIYLYHRKVGNLSRVVWKCVACDAEQHTIPILKIMTPPKCLACGRRGKYELFKIIGYYFSKTKAINALHSLNGQESKRFLSIISGRTKNAIDSYKLELETFYLEKEKVKLSLRCARDDEGNFLIDLTNDEWECVKIEKGSWKVIPSPLVFKRYPHMKPLTIAETANKEDLETFFELYKIEKEDRPLVAGYLAACWIAGIPHAILQIIGTQGSAKSSTQRAYKTILDPSSILLHSFPKDKAETIQLISHNYITAFDNVHTLSQEQSDILCKASTGEGFAKRALYTDEEDKVFDYQHGIMVNGLNLSSYAPDLNDRSILARNNRIPRTERKEETAVNKQLDYLAPRIRKLLLDALAQARLNIDEIPAHNLPRMADFARWGEACSRALGYEPNAFLTAYDNNQDSQRDDILEDSIVGDLLRKYLTKQGTKYAWKGKAQELLDILKDFAKSESVNTGDNFPINAIWLSRSLTPLIPLLQEEGFTIHAPKSDKRKGKRTSDRTWTILCKEAKIDDLDSMTVKMTSSEKIPSQLSTRENDVNDANDGICSNLTTLSPNVIFVKSKKIASLPSLPSFSDVKSSDGIFENDVILSKITEIDVKRDILKVQNSEGLFSIKDLLDKPREWGLIYDRLYRDGDIIEVTPGTFRLVRGIPYES